MHVADAKRGKTSVSESDWMNNHGSFVSHLCGIVDEKPITFQHSDENLSEDI